MRRLLRAVGILHATVFLLLSLVVSASGQCITGTVSAEFQSTGPFAGLYKYTFEIAWDTPQGLSNVTLDPNFSLCPEAACAADWYFEEVAGQGVSLEDGRCEFDLVGEFNCRGNPSIDYPGPVFKWDAVSTGGCDGGRSGFATLWFYSDLPPHPAEMPVGLIKNGQNICWAYIQGVVPLVCPVPVEPTTWGRLKALTGRNP